MAIVTAPVGDSTVQALMKEGVNEERDSFAGRGAFYDALQAKRGKEAMEPEPSWEDGATLLAVVEDTNGVGVVQVRRHQGELTGSIDRQPAELKKLNWHASNGEVAAMSALYVRRDARVLGVARRLAHEAIARARGMGCLAAVLRTGKLPEEGATRDQQAVRAFFHDLGFRKLDGPTIILHPEIDDDQADGMVMWLTEVPDEQKELQPQRKKTPPPLPVVRPRYFPAVRGEPR